MERMKYKKVFKTCFCTIILTILCSMPIWAGNWEPVESGGYKYKNDNGTYLANTWLQENGKWYFLNENGLMAVSANVEGYELGTDGAEISGVSAISSQYPQVIVPSEVQQQTTGQQTAQKQAAQGQAVMPQQTASETSAVATTTVTYVLNKNTKKFHKPSCSSVSDMAAKNRLDSGSSRDEVIAQGYVPCKRCKP